MPEGEVLFRGNETIIRRTEIPGLLTIQKLNRWDRGEKPGILYRPEEIKAACGIDFKPVQWNHSHSVPGTIRGIHAERMHKLACVARGTAFAAIVDLRRESNTYGRVVTLLVGKGGVDALFIPMGLGNSICCPDDVRELDYIYGVSATHEGQPIRVRYDDPTLAIHWPVKHPIVSEADLKNPFLSQQS